MGAHRRNPGTHSFSRLLTLHASEALSIQCPDSALFAEPRASEAGPSVTAPGGLPGLPFRCCPGSGPRGAILAQACIASAIGVRVGRDPKLTSGWTNQWGQASVASPEVGRARSYSPDRG